MEIRLADYGDLDSIDKIYNQAIAMKMATADRVPYSKEERLKWFEAHEAARFPAYVAVEDNEVAGYMTLTSYRPRREALRYAVEISYFVEEKHRSKGLGSSLLEYGLRAAKDLDYKFVVAILMGHNIASIKLLEKFGFSEWGRLPSIAEYDGSWYDHLIYGLKVEDD
jgi:phosphinothricin acetyltransferase